jgi:NADP-dependent 3-hydroxy acid dehydrogenase YdfG
MEQLQGKVAVITGSTSGIGKALARAFAGKGVQLVLHGRDEDKLVQLAAETSAAYVLGDITRPDIPGRLLETALQRFGRCDIAVNNAGLLENGPVEAIDIEKVCTMVRVNVEAAFRVAFTFAKHFKARDAGDLINISSVMGTKVRETAGAYAGTKFAVEALSEGLRLEFATTNVRVSCIEPGVVETGLDRRQDTPTAQKLNIAQPLVAEDIVDAVLYILQQDRNIRIPKLMILPRGHVV